MACERTHVDDTSFGRLVVKEKEADSYSSSLQQKKHSAGRSTEEH